MHVAGLFVLAIMVLFVLIIAGGVTVLVLALTRKSPAQPPAKPPAPPADPYLK